MNVFPSIFGGQIRVMDTEQFHISLMKNTVLPSV